MRRFVKEISTTLQKIVRYCTAYLLRTAPLIQRATYAVRHIVAPYAATISNALQGRIKRWLSHAHRRTATAVIIGLVCSGSLAYAVPPLTGYTPGQTLDPSCAPGESNCSVVTGIVSTINGVTPDNSGNVQIQSVQGTVSSDASPNVELLSSSGWTTTGWTGSYPSFTHTTGNTTALENSLVLTADKYYRVNYTITGQTAGSVSFLVDGATYDSGTSITYGFIISPTSSGTIAVLPTSTFDGTISVSIMQVTDPSFTFYNSSKTRGLEFRVVNSDSNIFIGTLAGASYVTGEYNTYLGFSAGQNITNKTSNVAIGSFALMSTIGTTFPNTAVGYASLAYLNGGSGANTSIGTSSLFNNTSGQYNTALGYQPLLKNTIGSENTAVGMSTLYNNISGSTNTALGRLAGFNNSTGSGNVFLGYSAGYASTGSNKLYIANSQTTNLIHGDFSTGQVQINAATTPALTATAAFEVISTTRGVLLPRVTTTQRDAISTPATSLLVFNSTNNLYEFWNGTAWSGMLPILAGTLTGSSATSLVNLAQTWNTTGTPTALKLNITDTASNAAALLLDLQVGGVSKFSVAKSGVVTLTGNTSLASADYGNGVAGLTFTVGRNTNATNSGAGSINFTNKAGTSGYVWQDAAGNMRINSAAPTTANDTAGTVIGAQTSTRDTKQDISDYTDYEGALTIVSNVPLHTFKYIREVQGYGEDSPLAKAHLGFIADEVDPLFMQGNTIDQVSVNGLLIASVKALGIKVEALPVVADQTIAQKIASFLSGISQGIASITKVQTSELCVDEVCVTKDQFKRMVEQAGGVQVPPAGTSAPSSPQGDTTTASGATALVGDSPSTVEDTTTATSETTPVDSVAAPSETPPPSEAN